MPPVSHVQAGRVGHDPRDLPSVDQTRDLTRHDGGGGGNLRPLGHRRAFWRVMRLLSVLMGELTNKRGHGHRRLADECVRVRNVNRQRQLAQKADPGHKKQPLPATWAGLNLGGRWRYRLQCFNCLTSVPVVNVAGSRTPSVRGSSASSQQPNPRNTDTKQ